MSRPPPPITGELVVVALKAEKLQHQAPGKQNPFCIFRVGDVVKRTKIDHGGGQYPIWDDQVNIPVAAGYHQMHVQIFDRDTNNPNNLMAEGVVDLNKVLREKEHDGYFPLQYRGRQGCGDIYLELTFYTAQNNARPQQQVRYQHPPGYIPGGNQGGYGPLPPLQQNRPPPPQQQHMQHRPPPPQMHPPPPQQHRPPPSTPNRPSPMMQQHRPPPMHQHMPSPMQPQQQQRPSHLHMPPQPQHSPYPQPRPSSSMGTSHFSPVMPSPQPLLSQPYHPAPSPASRPANLNYPDHSRPPYPYQQQQQGPPPGGFHDGSRPPMGFHQPPQNMRPLPPPPNGYNQRPPPPHGGYPPY